MDPTTSNPNHVIAYALSMWANYIETGDPCIGSADKQKMGQPVRALSVDQMRAVVRLRDMAAEQYRRS